MAQPGEDQQADHRLSSSLDSAPPLIIVSARGHSDESRRIVRAQAARASAAQSRVTRARNREGRERDSPLSPIQRTHAYHAGPRIQSATTAASSRLNPPTFYSVPDSAGSTHPADADGVKPMMRWATTLLDMSPIMERESTANLEPAAQFHPSLPKFPDLRGTLPDPQSPEIHGSPSDGDFNAFRLPVALPRGFARLQQRLQISNPMLGLLSRTACVDFASPGVEHRLHHLLYDLNVASAGRELSSVQDDRHPIEGHLRVACTCLTIVSLRENTSLDSLQQYTDGFRAAYNETMLLDRRCLFEENSAEVALWAMFIISVTTGATTSYFYEQLHTLLADMQLHHWEAVRRVLLEFIYPVSLLDQPCKDFYETLCQTPPQSTRMQA